jgi:hypothetical protein
MKHYERYLIRQADRFEPEKFSSVTDEINMINERSESFPDLFKSEILVSFLTNHSLQDDWIAANPGLANLVTSGGLSTGSIQSLFESSRNNPTFRQELENYLKEMFTKETSPGKPV